MGYERFFGLRAAPFSLAPNPQYFFESRQHASALQQLTDTIDRREPLIVMTGEIGTGKTLLCRAVLQRLDGQTFVSVINDPLLDRDDLLRRMLEDFGVLSGDRVQIASVSRHELVHALEDFLSSLGAVGGHAVVMIDEAQHLRPEVLEQIRLLSNIDTPKATLLQIILAGQLDLESLLARPELRQVQQRVSRRIRLGPLEEEELQAYIDHRLGVGRVAGSPLPGLSELARALDEWEGDGAGVTFTPDAVQAIWRRSAGLPRVINVLCDRALEEAYRARVRTVDARLVELAAGHLEPRGEAVPSPVADAAEPLPRSVPSDPVAFEWEEPAKPRWTTRSIATFAGIAVLGGLAGWLLVNGAWSGSPGAAPSRLAPVPAAPAATPSPAPAEPAVPVAPKEVPPSEPPPTPAAAAPAGAFEIVIASFRTDARAAAVASQVKDAGVPVRQREAGGWQQVLAGPFASREEAEATRARLERAGFSGTRIIATTP